MTHLLLLLWNLDPNHLIAIGLLGMILGQLAMYLPNGQFKDFCLRILHGIFPSLQIMVNGTVKTLKNVNPVAISIVESVEQSVEKTVEKTVTTGPTGPTGA
jgi:hypothetical protein